MGWEQHKKALLDGVAPRFPVEITLVNRAYDSVLVNGTTLERIFKKIPGYTSMIRTATSDNYDWFWIFEFRTGGFWKRKHSIMVAFPWSTDYRADAETNMDRSVAVYASDKVSETEIALLLLKIEKAIKDYQIERLKERLQEYQRREFVALGDYS